MKNVSRAVGLVVIAMCVILAMASLFAAAVPFHQVRQRLDAIAGDGSADPYTVPLHRRIQLVLTVFGCTSLAAAIFLWRMRPRFHELLERSSARFTRDGILLWRVMKWTVRGGVPALLCVTAVGFAIRAPFLNGPMRFDEAHTYVNYASAPWFVTISNYDAPNNHVFHSVCVSVVTRLFGDDPWVIRLPAFISGVLLVPACYFLGRCWQCRSGALLGSLSVAASSQLIEYSVNARGYSTQALIVIFCIFLTEVVIRQHNRMAALLLVVALSLGFWTIPTMLYPATAIGSYVVLRKWSGSPMSRCAKSYWRRWVLITLASAAAVVLLYSPILVVHGPRALTSNRYVALDPTENVILGLPELAASISAWMLRDLPFALRAACVAGWIAFLASNERGRGALRRWGFIAAGSCLVIVAAQRAYPPVRVWLFALPIVHVAAACGLAGLATFFLPATGNLNTSDRFAPAGIKRFAPVAVQLLLLGLLFVWPMISVVRSDSMRTPALFSSCPEAVDIVTMFKSELTGDEPIIAVSPTSAPLIYYARRAGLSMRHFDRPTRAHRSDAYSYLVVTKSKPQSPTSVLEELDLRNVYETTPFEAWREFPTMTIYRSAHVR